MDERYEIFLNLVDMFFFSSFGQNFSFNFHASPMDLFEELVSFEVGIKLQDLCYQTSQSLS